MTTNSINSGPYMYMNVGGTGGERPSPPENAPDLFNIIDKAELVYGNQLGEGHFGVVYKGQWGRYPVAIKTIKLLNTPQGQAALKVLFDEAERVAKLSHPHIVTLYGVVKDPEAPAMVFEYLSGGSLDNYLASGVPIDWKVRFGFSYDIALGLAYLHSVKIAHRDVKSPNVLLTDQLQAKIGDFGISRENNESKTATTSDGAIGSTCWMSPELFEPQPKYSKRCDIYSLGILFWEIASRQKPWGNISIQRVGAIVTRGGRPEIPVETPAPFSALIKKCWDQDQHNRPTADSVVQTLITIDPKLQVNVVLPSSPLTSHISISPRPAYTPELCFQALEEGNLPQLKQWLQEDSSRLSIRNETQETLLHVAIRLRRREVFETLLKDNILLNLADESGKTPFHVAAQYGYIDMGELLLSRKPNFPNVLAKRDRSAAHVAAAAGQLEFLQWLEKKGFEIVNQKDKDGWTPFHDAVSAGAVPTALWLLKKTKALILPDQSTPLHIAAQFGHGPMIDMLIQNDPTALLNTKWMNRVNEQGFTPVLSAAHHNQPQAFDRLCHAKAPLNVKDKEGYSPIHWICKMGSKEALATAFQHNVNVQALGPYNRTALHMAAYNGHPDLIEPLLSKGVKVNAQTTPEDQSKTALHEAVMQNRLAVIQKLTQSPQLNVMVKDAEGHIPLWHAVRDGQVEIARLLLRHPSFINTSNTTDPNSLFSLLRMKIYANETEVRQLLKDAGAS